MRPKTLFLFAVLMLAALTGCRFSYSATSTTEDDLPEMIDEEPDDSELPSER